MDIDIPLKAKGKGETIYSKIPLDVIDFETQYTHRMVPREFFIENKGSKTQKLTWTRKKPEKKKDEAGGGDD